MPPPALLLPPPCHYCCHHHLLLLLLLPSHLPVAATPYCCGVAAIFTYCVRPSKTSSTMELCRCCSLHCLLCFYSMICKQTALLAITDHGQSLIDATSKTG